VNEEALAHWGAVTPKQTNKYSRKIYEINVTPDKPIKI